MFKKKIKLLLLIYLFILPGSPFTCHACHPCFSLLVDEVLEFLNKAWGGGGAHCSLTWVQDEQVWSSFQRLRDQSER